MMTLRQDGKTCIFMSSSCTSGETVNKSCSEVLEPQCFCFFAAACDMIQKSTCRCLKVLVCLYLPWNGREVVKKWSMRQKRSKKQKTKSTRTNPKNTQNTEWRMCTVNMSTNEIKVKHKLHFEGNGRDILSLFKFIFVLYLCVGDLPLPESVHRGTRPTCHQSGWWWCWKTVMFASSSVLTPEEIQL